MLLGYLRELWKDLVQYTMPHQLMEDDKSDDVIEMIELFYGDQRNEFDMSPESSASRDSSGCNNLELGIYARMNTTLGNPYPDGWGGQFIGTDVPDECVVKSDGWYIRDDLCAPMIFLLASGVVGEGFTPRWVDVTPGVDYVVSLDTDVLAGGMVLSRLYVYGGTDGVPVGGAISEIGISITSGIERVEGTFTVPEGINGLYFLYSLWAVDAANFYSLHFANFKVEEGVVATPFCVA